MKYSNLNYLKNLNENQRKSVINLDGPCLIVAGAGSGKTRVLTTRVAHIIKEKKAWPNQILCVTFTNKAASEMRERALKLMPNTTYPPLLATFHKFGLIFLKMNIHLLGRSNTFVIIDTDDKKKIIKNISQDIPFNMVAKEISKYKNNFLSSNDVFNMARDENGKMVAHIYENYIAYLNKNNLVSMTSNLCVEGIVLKHSEPIINLT